MHHIGVRRVSLVVNVFILGTGRNGSTTISRCFEHATNYTSAHETNIEVADTSRLDYPDQHIESDCRLAWLLGPLGRRYPDAKYIHLFRDPDDVADSFLARWTHHHPKLRDWNHPRRNLKRLRWTWTGEKQGIMKAFATGIIIGDHHDRPATARLMVDVVNENITEFLRDRPSMSAHLETLDTDLPRLWDWIGAEGDLDAAVAEAGVVHNAR